MEAYLIAHIFQDRTILQKPLYAYYKQNVWNLMQPDA